MKQPVSALLSQHSLDSPVAFGAGGTRTALDLLKDAAAVAAALPEPGRADLNRTGSSPEDSQVLLVFRSDRYAFAAALLGAWAKGHAVTLPPNQRGETIAQLLTQRRIAALLHDTAAGGHIAVPPLLGSWQADPLTRITPPSGVAAFALTSGSSGESQTWPKSAEQLLGEIFVLIQSFGALPGQRYMVTVPPTHLYGLLFGVLLPLCSGGAFVRETPLLPEVVAARVRDYDAQVLVSVPIHLRSAEVLEPGALSSLTRVFSSTAPLHESTSRNFSARHSLAITEIFGSTETGGIAFRDRSAHLRWQPFEGVKVSCEPDGKMVVHSPFSPSGGKTPYVSADRIELDNDGSFSHIGRDDGVVKVGGLRVSLPSQEEWLMQYPGVADSVVVAVPELARGMRLLCALVAADVDETALREAMSRNFDPTTLPKRFLFVERLPREANGKLPRNQVLRLFGLGPDGKPLSTALEFSEPVRDASKPSEFWKADVFIPADYVWYGGHFEGYPVMAGVVQLHELVGPLVNRSRPELGGIRSLLRVKFLERIAPGDRVTVELSFDEKLSECDFTIRKGSSSCSSGRIGFFPSASP